MDPVSSGWHSGLQSEVVMSMIIVVLDDSTTRKLARQSSADVQRRLVAHCRPAA